MPKTKPAIPFNTRLDPAVYDALEEYCKARGVTKVATVDKALRKLLGLPNKGVSTR